MWQGEHRDVYGTETHSQHGDIHVMGKAWRHAKDRGMETFKSEGPHGDMYGKNRDICVAHHMGHHIYIGARAGERRKET